MTALDYGYSHAGSASGNDDIWNPVLCHVQQLVRRGARVLDLGCGNGYRSAQLASAGYDVVGIDPSVSGIEIARATHPAIRFECAAADTMLPKRVGCFDAIISMEVVEHCASTAQFMDCIHQTLMPGGLAFVTTPYHGYLKNVAIAVLGRHDAHFNPLWEGGHIKFFSTATLSKAAESSGLGVRAVKRLGRIPVIAKSILLVAERTS